MRSMQAAIKEEKNYKEFKNILLFTAGKTVSVFGSAIYTFALGLYVLELTGSALSFAVSLILGTLPMVILNPIAGVVADKLDKKKLVVSMDFLSGLLLVAAYLLSAVYGLNLTLIYATTFLLTVFTIFFTVAFEAAKPNIVSEKLLLNINSISKIIDSVSSILGPMLGGVIFAVLDIRTFVLFNGISFIISAISEAFIDFRFNCSEEIKTESKATVNFIKDIKEGFAYLGKQNSIKSLIITLVALNFFLGFSVTVPMPYIINNVLKLDSAKFGMIQGAFPVGMIIGALLIKKISDSSSYFLIFKKISTALSICIIMLGLPILFTSISFIEIFYVIYYCLIMICFGILIAFIDIPIAYLMQKVIQEEYRGRVWSISISMAKALLPVALLTSGMLINMIPAYIMPFAGGVMLLIINTASVKSGSFYGKVG